MGCLLALSALGCDDAPTQTRARRAAVTTQPAAEHVEQAMDLLEHVDQYREQQALVKTAYHLNRWLESQPLSSDWKADEMVNRLPRAARERGVLDELPRRLFSVDDAQVIQEAVWMRQLSQWVARQPLPPYVEQWLKAQQAQLGADGTEQLAIAYRLFDWTVRNIQLDELSAYPDEAAVAPAAGTETHQATVPAALRAVPGPGYQLEPWQVLVYGHGDAWQRMRVFTLLARQQGIDVATLAFPGRSIPPRPRPWVSAVMLKDELYLFDPRLGLPIPSEDLHGIATLRQVMDDPTLLNALNFDEKHPYVVEKQDLSEIAALVDVLPANVSQRMQVLEKELVGEHRTVLTTRLSPLIERLRACRGIYDVYVWSVPIEAVWYRTAYNKRIQEDPQAAAQHLFRYGMFSDHAPLSRARYLYFRNEIESTEDDQGAKALLLEARITKEQLDQITTNEDVQRRFGLQRTGRETKEMWQAHVEAVKAMMIHTKQSATFWLGLLQLESGRTDSAIEWLDARTLGVWPDGIWTAAARYNLSRAYELEGDLAKAQEILLADTSPQQHGNYLRARILQQQLETREPKTDPPGEVTEPQ